VWPLVHAAVPEARLVIAGRGTDRLGITNGDGITVLGEIPSAAAFFSDASVLVVPLDRGSGMKVKVLEALASGVPTVTTPAGAEGVERGDGIVVCDRGDDESVARATASILRDDLERRQRGDTARALFERNYVPEVVAEPLVDLYIRMASDGAG
jgi:glycosyltransferase involved in cell wall biosynthesis